MGKSGSPRSPKDAANEFSAKIAVGNQLIFNRKVRKEGTKRTEKKLAAIKASRSLRLFRCALCGKIRYCLAIRNSY